MSLAHRLLPLRRLWWFLADHKTYVIFRLPCRHCGDEIVIQGKGFGIFWLQGSRHNPVCIYAPFFNTKPHKGSFWCHNCWRRLSYIVRWFIVQRWHFRLKYNWGIVE